MKFRSLFISDVHLGTVFCQSEKLLNFLKSLEDSHGHYPKELEYIYLVGDIVDLTNCNISYLFKHHKVIIKKIFRMAEKGITVIYVPGNHDFYFRQEHNSIFQTNFLIKNKTIHTSLSGKRWLITHGDQFDTAIKFFPFAYSLGDFALNRLYELSRVITCIRKRLNYHTDFSLVAYLKGRVKNIIQFISSYSTLLSKEAEDKNVDGVICGHIHKAELKYIKGEKKDILYANCGCWTEAGQETFLIETIKGELELWKYSDYLLKK